MKKNVKKGLVATSVLFFMMIFSLAFIPHYACACGEYEDGSYLTHVVNGVSEKVFGKPIIEKNKSPY
jgi:hypothetical protein